MRKGINITLTAIVLVALVVFCFFIQCKWDIVTIVAGFIVAAIAAFVSYKQEKKLKEVEEQ